MPSWNHTLDDTDPFVSYSPFADGDYTAGWAGWFANSGGFLTRAPGELGEGQSMHFTAVPDAKVEFEFHGTAVYLYGSANCTYDVTVDNISVASDASSDNDLLFSKTDFPLGRHFLSLTAHASPPAAFAFDKAIISDDFPDGVDELLPVTIDNQNSTLQYDGEWTVIGDSQVPNKTSPKPFRQTTDSLASVSLNFTGAAIAINAPVNWGHWTYDVSLDGVKKSYNASTYWLVGNTQLFWASGLDINKPHFIELTNTATDGMFMTLNDLTVYTTNASSATNSTSDPQNPSAASSPKISPAAIAGAIVAAMIGLIIILVGAYYWKRRRTREQLMDAIPEPYFEPGAPDATFTAYATNTDAAEKGGHVVVSPGATSIVTISVRHDGSTVTESDSALDEDRVWYNPHSPTSQESPSQPGAQLSHSVSSRSRQTETSDVLSPVYRLHDTSIVRAH